MKVSIIECQREHIKGYDLTIEGVFFGFFVTLKLIKEKIKEVKEENEKRSI